MVPTARLAECVQSRYETGSVDRVWQVLDTRKVVFLYCFWKDVRYAAG
jgi:hypothetical protein